MIIIFNFYDDNVTNINGRRTAEFMDITNLLNSPNLSDRVFGHWFSDHSELNPYITLFSSNSDKNKFSQRRRGVHNRTIDDLTTFISTINSLIRDLENDLAALHSQRVPTVAKMCYDDIQSIIILRKIAFLKRKIQTRKISLATHRYEMLREIGHNAKMFLELFSSNIIPEYYLCKLDPIFFNIHFGPIINKDLKALQYLQPAVDRLQAEIDKKPKSLWDSSFSDFLKQLVNEAAPHIDPDLSYCLPFESEVSLSRCLFHHMSQYIPKIDPVLKNIKTKECHDFIHDVLDVCYNMILMRDSMSTFEQSIALLMLYRALFNRCYEKFSYLFAPKLDKDIEKIAKIKLLPAKIFPLPWELLSVTFAQTTIKETIRDLFRNDNIFYSASLFLYQSIFEPNPIDTLFNVHKTLILIHKGALINRMKGAPASIDDVNQILCFDDLFSLFFGTMTASDVPDIFSIARFIDQYAPKPCLSPSFEYAQANIEALVIHCRNFDLEKMEAEAEIARAQNIYPNINESTNGPIHENNENDDHVDTKGVNGKESELERETNTEMKVELNTMPRNEVSDESDGLLKKGEGDDVFDAIEKSENMTKIEEIKDDSLETGSLTVVAAT
ncbi:hypothetical protein TRFO_12280 [Tritrichomonas foetus]|uniref:VPS9 domain-containing protein n=1 Tax=Tritrichomonas foetus TaxID=1144522 RepID=A0A1J4J1U9_9EUKA|nr:hypothetical protein TRFO_12280 [Tritrichomonas foetus]|eukprot:OHS92737.1 hypothetical protein TRFO_12280 [Tritrichomonas foetus]